LMSIWREREHISLALTAVAWVSVGAGSKRSVQRATDVT
jgi:hypothetical protein